MGRIVRNHKNCTEGRLGDVNLSRTSGFFASLLFAAGACYISAGHAEGRDMNSDNTTICLGRYLIDAPRGASIKATYKYGGNIVETLRGINKDKFEARVAARESELKRSPHTGGGTLFVARTEFSPTKISLSSWASQNSRLVHLNETYSFIPETAVAYYSKGESSARYQQRSLELRNALSNAFRYRAATEIPKDPGFCIDLGLIARSKLNNEEFRAGLHLKDYPSINISLNSYVTGKPDIDLLERSSHTPPGFEQAIAGMKVLRRGNRNVGMATGQELLVRGESNGKRSYEFLWESQGRASSIEFPFTSLQLSTTSASDDKGEVIDAPFKSDEEALQLWDSLLSTLRPRPGAI